MVSEHEETRTSAGLGRGGRLKERICIAFGHQLPYRRLWNMLPTRFLSQQFTMSTKAGLD